MNKDNRKNGDTGGDNIITKKGFMIALPTKKNTDLTKSSINFSSPQNNNQSQSEERKPHGDKNKNHKKHGKNHHKKAANENKNNQGQNGNHNDVKRDAAPQNNPQKNNNQKHQGNNNQSKKFDKNNRHGKNRDNHDNRDNRNHNKNQTQKMPQRQPLSSLSREIADFEAKKAVEKKTFEASFAQSSVSLEEKYKDAIPLSQQIEMEEKKRKNPHAYADFSGIEKTEIVGIRFREAGKIYYFDPAGQTVPFGSAVIVETARGSEYGFAAISNRLIPSDSLVSPLKPIVRLATKEDTQKYLANKDLEADAAKVFLEKVAALKLEMNLIYVEYTFDNSKLLFYFTAETRIDFRELVKELASVFRTRIELRQIGVRDEAKAIGCLGVCGRSACCSTYLSDFAQVSIKMAKDQNLSLNAAKISGACGKLMCCLRYEDKVYEQENQKTPKLGAIVNTPEGKGIVTDREVLKGIVKVTLDSAPETAPKPFKRDDVVVVGFSKQASDNDGIDDNADELKDED